MRAPRRTPAAPSTSARPGVRWSRASPARSLPEIVMHNLQKSAGFTMLEVMISIVIIAFGLLGIAGLQAFALKNSQSASARLTATTLASDIIDRMKTNVAGVSSGAYDQAAAAAY